MRDPIEKFKSWFDEAKRHPSIIDATAMCLATADAHAQPSARMVLLKGIDARGFVFYTHLDSRKSIELKRNPKAALCFHWPPIEKQVRIEGSVELVSDKEADAYFATRPRESRIAAWASDQSKPLSSQQDLRRKVDVLTAKFDGRDIPRPDFWSGWRVIPERLEFWKQGEFRLHEREAYTRTRDGWKMEILYP